MDILNIIIGTIIMFFSWVLKGIIRHWALLLALWFFGALMNQLSGGLLTHLQKLDSTMNKVNDRLEQIETDISLKLK